MYTCVCCRLVAGTHHVKQQAQVQLRIPGILAQAVGALARKQRHRLAAAAAAAAPACCCTLCCQRAYYGCLAGARRAMQQDTSAAQRRQTEAHIWCQLKPQHTHSTELPSAAVSGRREHDRLR